MEKELNFKFTEEQMNYIINVLATRPFSEVQGLMNLINEQYQQQSTLEVKK